MHAKTITPWLTALTLAVALVGCGSKKTEPTKVKSSDAAKPAASKAADPDEPDEPEEPAADEEEDQG